MANNYATKSIRKLVSEGWHVRYVIETLVYELRREAKRMIAYEPDDDQAASMLGDAHVLESILDELDQEA